MKTLIRFINSSHFVTIAFFVTLSFLVVSNSHKQHADPTAEPTAQPVAAAPTTDPGPALPGDDPGQQEITGRVRKGDTLGTALTRSKIPDEAKEQIIKSLRTKLDFRNLLPTHQYTVTVDEEGSLIRCQYEAGPLDAYTIARTDDGYETSKNEVTLERRTVKLSGEVESSLFNAFARRDEDPKLVYAFADIFAAKIDFNTEIRRGDRFSLVVEKYYKDDELIGYGKILAVRYERRDKEVLEGYYFDNRKGGSYFDPAGNELGASFIRSPLAIVRVSSGFTNQRRHPVTGVIRPHLGVDLAAPTGTPVMAAADGTVKSIGWSGGFGKLIVIDHGAGMTTYYGHLSRYAKGLKKGDRVRQKELIGYVGSTGLSTGPHLHYQIGVNGDFRNPFSQKFRPKSVLAGSERHRFDETTRELRQYLAPPEELFVVEVEDVKVDSADDIRFL